MERPRTSPLQQALADAANAPLQTLLIDNYDSFTFNLYQMIADVNGAYPTVIRNDDAVEWDSLHFDNIVLSPGPGRPDRAEDFGICLEALKRAEVPILGICLGHQGIGHCFGGRVALAPEPMHGRLSRIYHSDDDLFHGIPSPVSVVRYHSLMVERPLPPDLEEIAWTEDQLIMGFRHRSLPIWGVQFHPESICTEYGARLLENFAHQTRQRFAADYGAGPPVPRGPRLVVATPGVGTAMAPAAVEPVDPAAPKAAPADVVVLSRKLDVAVDSESVFMHLFGDSACAYWLDSSQVEAGLSRFSFMGDDSGPEAFVLRYDMQQRELTITRHGQETRHREEIFDYLRRELARWQTVPTDLPFELQGGLVGYFGYELKAECGGAPHHQSAQPDACFLFSDRLVAFDHQTGAVYLVALAHDGYTDDAWRWIDATDSRLRNLPPCPPIPRPAQPSPLHFRLGRDRRRYLEDIRICQEEIRCGETYEVCLTQQMHVDTSVDPLTLYRVLRHSNPAPYASFLRFPGFAVASCSPERFVRIDRAGWAESKPIKGTSRRDPDHAVDRALAEELRNSEKDRSENLMIVDLVRNDLGRTCEVGTVTVPKLMSIESYATVHQMVSTIRGHLRSEMGVIDCIRAAFPGGSMTGAPKVRTMHIIDRLENEARGIYSGSIGYISTTGAADLNIVIRTAVMAEGSLTIGVGGAIVALSDPAAEFDEILLKGQALVRGVSLAVNGEYAPEGCHIEGA